MSSHEHALQVDRVIHEPARLRILMILSGADAVSYNLLRKALGLTNGNLGAHLERLEQAGYIQVRKSFQGRTPHSDYSLTESGSQALGAYWATLDRLRAEGA